MKAVQNPDEAAGLAEFDSLFFRHVGYTISNFVRTLSLGITGGYATRAPVRGPEAHYYRQLTRMSSALALVSDISMMLLGGGLKRKERLSARLGDVLSNLYLGCAVLKFYRDSGSDPAELAYVHWNMQLALYNCQVAFKEFFENLPNRPVAWLMRLTVFPLGGHYKLPSDKLEHELVQPMFTDNPLRDRITEYMYIGKNDSDPAFIIEDTFQKLLACRETREKIRTAIKNSDIDGSLDLDGQADAAVAAELCSAAEAQAFVAAEQARQRAIQVDDYPPQFFT
jgi:hypothetical protein